MYAILNKENVCTMIVSNPSGYENVVETDTDVVGKKYINDRWEDAERINQEPTYEERMESKADYIMMMQGEGGKDYA